MKIKFHSQAYSDYSYFQTKDIKIFNKINKLLQDISSTPFIGLGKPEALRHNLSGFWSRRITKLQCRYHY